MDSLLNLTSTNWSYYTIPVAFVLVMVPHAHAISLAGKNYDLSNPRNTEALCAKDTTLPKHIAKRIGRAKAAAANGFETLGLYAASVVAGNVAGVATGRLNALTAAYLLSRALYNLVYVHLQENARVAVLRPLVWLAGIGLIMGTFVLAGLEGNR
ncbi:hypothetical protein BT67DRAFT_415526 [Trichocladium antarcticum]|uniref:MAPEG family protein n=1 Tax=Trichocladium antarcticum TaxID=1450529 RepID=A0AAN6UTW4_9PEZI|nr:hypothetical protein BT67DRAFT_415526 [Trichocladium antarcticum]